MGLTKVVRHVRMIQVALPIGAGSPVATKAARVLAATKAVDDRAAAIKEVATKEVATKEAGTKEVATKEAGTKAVVTKAVVTKGVAMPGADRGSHGRIAAFGVRPVSEVDRARDSRDPLVSKGNNRTRRIGRVTGPRGRSGRRIRRTRGVLNGRMSPTRMIARSGRNSRITRCVRWHRANPRDRAVQVLIAPFARIPPAVRFALRGPCTSRRRMSPERSIDAMPAGRRLPGQLGLWRGLGWTIPRTANFVRPSVRLSS